MSLDEAYRAARDEALRNPHKGAGDFERLPDGEYSMSLVKLTRKDLESGDVGVSWELEVTSGPMRGRKSYKMSFLNDKGIAFFASDLTRARLNLDSIAQLDYFVPMANEKALPRALDVKLVTKGKYQNVYINACSAPWFPAEPVTGAKENDPF